MKKHRILELLDAASTTLLPLRIERDTSQPPRIVTATGHAPSSSELALLIALRNALEANLEVIRQAGNVDSALRNGFVASVHNEALTSALENWNRLSDGPDTTKLRELWLKKEEASSELNSELEQLDMDPAVLGKLLQQWREEAEKGPESE